MGIKRLVAFPEHRGANHDSSDDKQRSEALHVMVSAVLSVYRRGFRAVGALTMGVVARKWAKSIAAGAVSGREYARAADSRAVPNSQGRRCHGSVADLQGRGVTGVGPGSAR